MEAQINHLKQPMVRTPQSEGGDLDRERRGRDGPINGERRREGGRWAARLMGLQPIKRGRLPASLRTPNKRLAGAGAAGI